MISSIFKAKTWTGAGWLLALCVILIVVGFTYYLLHKGYHGSDHKQLDNTELANLDNVLSAFPDSAKKPADVRTQREHRDNSINAFLRNEYNGQTEEDGLKRLDTLLTGLSTKDTKTYFSTKPIMVNGFFWFNGELTYLEVLFWALIGVLVSLLYYVSLALASNNSHQAGDADSGTFDPCQISGQVAKMFYAPVCALVLVLGYNLLNSDNKMTDISIGKGMLVFSFICGFFSGRVMKFIDRLKELVLPGSSTDGATGGGGATAGSTAADITANLQLSAAAAGSAEGPDITEGGFNTAVVTLDPGAGGTIITLQAPADDQAAGFTSKQVAFGKYTLKATMAFNNAGTVINLSGSKDVEVSATNTTFPLELDKTADQG